MRKAKLLILLSLFAATASRAAEPSAWRVFAQYDYFAPANSKAGLQDQLHVLSDQFVNTGAADSVVTAVSANGGSGSRLGVLRRLDRRTDIGASVGYVLGPTMNANLSAASRANGNGGLTVNRSATYVRLLLQTSTKLVDRNPWSVSLDSGLGLGLGHVDQSCNSSGSLACAGNVATTDADWAGFTWGFGLDISRTFELATLGFGPHYEGFPRFKGNDQVAAIDWQAFGLFLSAQF